MQIIEEQLAFPSGTATAHLISALHQLPPPDTGLRRRAGYQAINDTDDPENTRHNARQSESRLLNSDDAEMAEAAVARQDGWQALLWSFFISGAMTVSAACRNSPN